MNVLNETTPRPRLSLPFGNSPNGAMSRIRPALPKRPAVLSGRELQKIVADMLG
jgi:hypothetical protein